MESDYGDIGLAIGTGIFMVFGLLIAFVLPKVFAKDEEVNEDNLRFMKWLRWLGLFLFFISIVAVVAILFLP